ncbi:MAG: amino acid permease [Alphaproteobacteria bacterium]|nr:amino acid permease [Alphaproteobacteria bacterium]
MPAGDRGRSQVKQTAHGSVTYTEVDGSYFAARGLRRHAGVLALWALGVGAVISGHFSGWNLGLATGGWGGLFLATLVITVMYLGLAFSIAEMSAALPHTGAAYSFARSAMGPWGGFVTGLCENVEYVLAPTVIVSFIGAYLGSIFGFPTAHQPVFWIATYVVFVWLNVHGVAMTFRVTVAVTVAALACLVAFWLSALPSADFSRWALDIGAGPDGAPVRLQGGGGPFLPFGIAGVLASLPYAVWLFLAIEELPLAAEESLDPRRDMPKGLVLGMATLILSAFLTMWLNSSIPSGAFALSTSTEPRLDGFKAIYGEGIARLLALVAVVGLIASFHTIIFAKGRQIYSLSRAGYFPRALSLTHGARKTPHVAMVVGSLVGLVLMAVVWGVLGPERGTAVISGMLLNMVVFAAMVSYVMQAVSFIVLRRVRPQMERPYRSPFGIPGAVATIAIALVTLGFQLADPVYRAGVIAVAVWFAVCIAYFALVGRHRLVLSPEEKFAMTGGRSGYESH